MVIHLTIMHIGHIDLKKKKITSISIYTDNNITNFTVVIEI